MRAKNVNQSSDFPVRRTGSYRHKKALFFTDRMPFLPPNQQRQSTEGNKTKPSK